MTRNNAIRNSIILAACAPIMFAAVPASAQKSVTVCADRNGGTKEMTVIVSNRCVSSSHKYRGNSFKVDVRQETASITVDGAFDYKKPAGGIGTTDCGGAKTLEFKVPNTEARRYSVFVNGTYRGVIDFEQHHKRTCPKTHERMAFNVPANTAFRLSRTHAKIDLSNWQVKEAGSLMALLAPIIGNHPESTDGRPSLQIDAVKRPNGPGMYVQIVSLGLLDDSVSGESYIAIVDEGDSGWVLKELWKRSLCGRGGRAGQWTKGKCT